MQQDWENLIDRSADHPVVRADGLFKEIDACIAKVLPKYEAEVRILQSLPPPSGPVTELPKSVLVSWFNSTGLNASYLAHTGSRTLKSMSRRLSNSLTTTILRWRS